jgi:hypothetical protein
MSQDLRPCAHDDIARDPVEIEYNSDGTADVSLRWGMRRVCDAAREIQLLTGRLRSGNIERHGAAHSILIPPKILVALMS